jgi:uncharacterized OB-fold protein
MSDHASGARLEAHRCPNGHLTYPAHPLCPECGEHQVETVDLTDRTAEVVTWTTSTATPPGVREPNTLAIVAFDVAGRTVRALGQVTTDEVPASESSGSPGDEHGESPGVAVGDEVEPVYEAELRDPEAGIREPESQAWDGFRFRPV